MLHIYHLEESDLSHRIRVTWPGFLCGVCFKCLVTLTDISYVAICYLVFIIQVSTFVVAIVASPFPVLFTSCLCLLSFVIVCPTCVLFRLQRSDQTKVSRVPDWVPLVLAQNRKLRLWFTQADQN